MKKILLTRECVALVDDADFDDISQFHWHAKKCGNADLFYACRNARTPSGRGVEIMHRRIMGLTDPKILVDHKNGNTLDNQRANLRTCNPVQNQGNQHTPIKARSGYRGVRIDGKRFTAFLRRRYIGSFPTAREAALAWDREAVELFGEFAVLNIPNKEAERE